jgi:hypothetical protein
MVTTLNSTAKSENYMNKTLIASAMLLATSATYGMHVNYHYFDDTARNNIVVLQNAFPNLQPITKKKSEGAIHAYHDPNIKLTHVLVATYKNQVFRFKKYYVDNKHVLREIGSIQLTEYDVTLECWEGKWQNYGKLIRLPLHK